MTHVRTALSWLPPSLRNKFLFLRAKRNGHQSSGPHSPRRSRCSGLVTSREGGRKTTYSGEVQAGDPRSRHYRRDPIGPRVSLVQPRTSQPGASSLPPQDYLPAPPTVEARQQNSLGAHPTGRENPSFLRAKRATPLARQQPERLLLPQRNLHQR